jgi:nitronate monooxygenase
MPLPDLLRDRLSIPVVAAPMFLVSGPELVIATCRQGMVGTFPALNQRTSEGYARDLERINAALEEIAQEQGRPPAPFGINLIVHRSNPRLEEDLRTTIEHRVPIVITSLGAVAEIVDAIHAYGGIVFHDVTNLRHARKAAQAGVDGLILVAAGAGGHAGTMSPFALVSEVRRFFEGTILLAGCINEGHQILAAQIMGADLAYMGTRFICTRESMASPEYQQMILEAKAADTVHTPAVSGVPATFLRQSLINAGIDPDKPPADKPVDFGKELAAAGAKPWKDIWSAGQGVGGIDDVPTVAELHRRLLDDYRAAVERVKQGL